MRLDRASLAALEYRAGQAAEVDVLRRAVTLADRTVRIGQSLALPTGKAVRCPSDLKTMRRGPASQT